ncbi:MULTISPECIES: RpiB/LacA/LacB family sugar-phosphate isomerase [unclassified Lactococcus]|uniref:RpiB/LacA/LacB family sugar-phosphate isomerase n=1 Tax=unclassified Lactococcus TaxID=2643510 RepID=UPI0011C86EBF|nr:MULTISPECIES: RpiB/LacA/LacB family sugar-phosphate isomerase [unclassified Lactococcus]MQW23303.1 sugar phosphate isomerase [Lactococcus sp. dk101]TXK38031.1 sugar phosphate isomerase [Lactococcus sp. dk310]TXK49710.1 sugar phosphate isomerase [Lactococcus sp. dk322]
MNIAVIQASTQVARNQLLFEETKRATSETDDMVFNFGVSSEEDNYSYIQIAICVGLLLNSVAIDFVVTGCSSGNGMAIAANVLPNVICAYTPTPSDAYLFGRINQGNCVSLPLGLNFGWAGELNLRFTLEKLFESPMNTGYPKASAERKMKDVLMLKKVKELGQTDMIAILSGLTEDIIRPIFKKTDLIDFIIENGTSIKIVDYLRTQR